MQALQLCDRRSRFIGKKNGALVFNFTCRDLRQKDGQMHGDSATDLRTADKESYFHPFTAIREQQKNGPLVIVKGEGASLWDAAGNHYLDAAAGLWCVNVGYGRQEISRAIHEQSERLPYYHSFNSMANEPAICLSERLLRLAPPSMCRVFYGSSGSDANDTAIKLLWYFNIARGQPEKKKIISRRYGYHGVTVASGSLSGLPMVHAGFGLPLDFARHVSRPDTYRDMAERGISREREYAAALAKELNDLIEKEGPETVAGFIAEPVMGTGGVHVPPEGYFAEVKAVLDRHDVALIADEVITGFGRLGAWFGATLFDIQPDLITTAKGLTSGYLPLSAVLVGKKIWDVIESVSADSRVFGHGFTYSGHPTCAAAALANLDIIERENLVQRTHRMGLRFLEELKERCANLPLVGSVRGCGLMAGVELVSDKNTRLPFEPAAKIAARVALEARSKGVLVRALPNSNVVAMSPPFIIGDDDIGRICEAVAHALTEVADELAREGHLAAANAL